MRFFNISFILLFYNVISLFAFLFENEQNYDLPTIIQKMSKNSFSYDRNGILTLFQRNKTLAGKSDEEAIFFKEKLAKCNDENADYPAMYFDIDVCIPADETCVEGISICYLSELQLSDNKINDKKYLMDGNWKAECENKAGIHALKIEIHAAYLVKIRSTIDDEIYEFELPKIKKEKQCFKIRVGTEDSIETVITDIDDNPVNDVTPTMDKWDPNLLKTGWSSLKKRFHLFSLDFIPKRNKWLENFGDYKKNFYYNWPSGQCNMAIQFHGPKLHQCLSEWVDIGYTCPGPVFSSAFGEEYAKIKCNSSEYIQRSMGGRKSVCSYEFTRSENNKYSRIARDVYSSGLSDEHDDGFKLTFLPNSIVQALTPGFRRSYQKMWLSGNATEREKLKDYMEKDFKHYKIQERHHVPVGCIYRHHELYIICNGWRWKTGKIAGIYEPYKTEPAS